MLLIACGRSYLPKRLKKYWYISKLIYTCIGRYMNDITFININSLTTFGKTCGKIPFSQKKNLTFRQKFCMSPKGIT